MAIVSEKPGDAFWSEVRKTKWIDATRMVGVCRCRLQPALDRLKPVPTQIIEDNSVPAGFYRQEGHVIRVRGIQSFAAGYIAHELKTNGFR